jgi:hypothetical protein
MHKYEREANAIGKVSFELTGVGTMVWCRQGSFSFAWVLDQQEAERSRGVTIDVAIKAFETPNRMVKNPSCFSRTAESEVSVMSVLTQY